MPLVNPQGQNSKKTRGSPYQAFWLSSNLPLTWVKPVNGYEPPNRGRTRSAGRGQLALEIRDWFVKTDKKHDTSLTVFAGGKQVYSFNRQFSCQKAPMVKCLKNCKLQRESETTRFLFEKRPLQNQYLSPLYRTSGTKGVKFEAIPSMPCHSASTTDDKPACPPSAAPEQT